jgi:glycolate dehydrogenase iron-sulfur subunit
MSEPSPGLRALDYSLIQQCMHCGMCLPTCPTYDATHRERSSPRGRIALMRAVADGALEISDLFADELSYCLGCLACQTACPAGVNYSVLFETARTDIEDAAIHSSPSRRFWRWLTLEYLFTHPRALRTAGRLVGWYQRCGLQALVRRTGLIRLLPSALQRLEPQTPVIAPSFSNALIARREEPRGRVRYRVALLTGCIQDLVYPNINRDTADVLLANGCVVDTPSPQPCCGSLHAHNGDRRTAALLARRMIDLIPPDDYDAIITNAGGCGSHLRHYSSLLADDPQYARAGRVWDARVQDIHQWLARIDCRAPAAPPFAEPVSVTYHDSCHLAHGQKVTREPRELLRLIPGLSLVDLQESTWCCGSAGVYAITQPDQAQALLERKVRHIKETSATIVATANPGCHLQITQGLNRAALPVQVFHPVSLLARAYRAEGRSSA